MSETPRRCPGCGAEATGKFCSRCGTPLAPPDACPACGAPLSTGAMYCSECGHGVAAPRPKPVAARLPWILSALALAAFSVVIALLVQGNSSARSGDMLPTGNLPGMGGAAGAEASGGGMPSMEELLAMGPRAAADRLFERAMREHETNPAGAAQFVQMGLRAYAGVPPEEMDADGRFHLGLLQLLSGDPTAARETGEGILSGDPDHLLGLILMARVEDFAQDEEAAADHRARLREIVAAAGGIPDRPEYQAHRTIIERELAAEGAGS